VVKIVHLSDLHIESEPERMYPGVAATLKRVPDLLRAEEPDLLLVSGDLTSHGSADRAELEQAKAWLQDLHLPYLVVPGNHDLGANPQRGEESPAAERYDPGPFADTHFAAVFGSDLVSAHEVGGVRVLGVVIRESDFDRAVPALRSELARSEQPTIVVGHYPLIHTRDHGVLAGSPVSDRAPAALGHLKDVLCGSPTVCLYAFGHVHACTLRPVGGGIVQVSAGGLGPGASLYRTYVIQDGQLHILTRLGPGPLGFWERLYPAGNYTSEYHLGTPQERSATLTLPRRCEK
jgi:3',5'-cyclic AMP phosphodiesterase CpdA